MCGIGGVLLPPGSDAGPDLDRIARSLLERLAHRGPDGAGVHALAPSGSRTLPDASALPRDATGILVHRRLAILDLTETGAQPMSTRDGALTVVFNGEIYNYVELRRELEGLGHSFRSSSDTEVLLEAWREWGPRALPRLVGMFAFALVDARARRLVLARDPFGIKPLVYARWRGGFAFASEVQALLALPGVDRRADPRVLHRFLSGHSTDGSPATFFAAIRQVPAAHWLEVPLDGPYEPSPTRYFSLDLSRRSELSFEDAAERLRELFLESVRLHSRSDVPVGAALSGGIDSSAIALSVRLLEGAGAELHTFSYVASDPALSEERWIDIAANAAASTGHKVSILGGELANDLERLVALQGEPFGSTSIYAQDRVFALARRAGIKVMLDGQGADELFGGYIADSRRRAELLLRQGRWREAAAFVRSASRLPGREGLWRQAGRLLPGGLQRWLRRARRGELPWLREDWFRTHGVLDPGYDWTPRSFAEHLHRNLTEEVLPELLRYEDRDSMAHSVESRVPFLTTELASFVLSLPEEYLIAPDGTTKAVLRRALRGIVPDAILDRRDKIGFQTPESRWLREQSAWCDRILSSTTARRLPFWDHAELWREWERIRDGRSPFDARPWRWINVVEWVDGAQVAVE